MHIKHLKITIFIVSLLPFTWLIYGVLADSLGVNPIEELTRDTGEWTLRFLLITLAISPLKRLTGWRKPLQFRRMLGLFTLFYGTVHLLTYIWLDRFFYWEDIFYDILDRPFITVGMLAFLLMVPLGITSNNWSIRKLKKNWSKLHKLIYPIAILGVLHFWWVVKLDTIEPMIYAVILAILLGERIKHLTTVNA